MTPPFSRGALSNAAVHLSVCLSVCLSHSSTTMHVSYGYYRTLIGNHMLEIKLKWHRQFAPSNCCRWGRAYHFATLYFVWEAQL